MATVRNMTGRTGRPVANQFIIDTTEAQFFQSYRTVIAKRCNDTGAITLDSRAWDYSTTTGKYRNQFLRMNKAETEKLIKDGTITLADLN